MTYDTRTESWSDASLTTRSCAAMIFGSVLISHAQCQSNEKHLRLNVDRFRDLLIDIGFAKTYADGRTIVTTDEGRHR